MRRWKCRPFMVSGCSANAGARSSERGQCGRDEGGLLAGRHSLKDRRAPCVTRVQLSPFACILDQDVDFSPAEAAVDGGGKIVR
jgi:hypothetical protein